MPQASTSRAQLRYVAESVWGQVPAGPPKFTDLRFTGENLGHVPTTVQSAEIRSDGQVPDLIEVGAGANGTINFELSYGAYDDFLSALLHAAWVDYSFTGSVTVDDTNKSYSGTNISVGLVVGQYVRVQGCATAGNNGFKRVASIPGTGEFRVDETCVDEGPTASVEIDGSRLRNGVVEKSFVIEEEFTDLSSGHFKRFLGMEPSQMQLNIAADSIVSGQWTFIGKEGLNVSATAGDGSPNAAPAFDVFNATSNVGEVMEASPLVALATALQQLQFTVNGNLAARRAIKNRGAIGIRQGRLVVTGNINAYFESGALYAKMISQAASALHTRLHDTPALPASGRSYFLTFPRIKFTGGNPVAPAVDQDVFLNLGWQAVRDPVTGCTMQIDRFPTAP